MAKTDVFKVLKKTLRAKGVTYRDLARHLGMSESGVKKMFLAKDLPLGRLLEISEWLGVSAADLVRLMEREEIAEVELTPAQQEGLLKDPLLFRVYWRLSVDGESDERIRAAEKMTAAELQRKFLRLQRLELAVVDSAGRARARHRGLFRWTAGPLVDALNRDWSRKTLDAALARKGDGALHRLTALRMSDETRADLARALHAVADEFARRSQREQLTRKESELKDVRLLIATAAGRFIDEV